MASWSTRRKTGFFFGFLVFFALAVGLPTFLALYKAPTCSDGKQNGEERGVDCGGACTKLCPADFAMPKVLWSHSVRVVPGIYNSLAYIENPNPTVEAGSISYTFKLYDGDGILVAERKGKSFIPAGQRFAVFEGTIETGERFPVRTTFEFTGVPGWRPGMSLAKLRALSVDLADDGSPKAEARVKNESVDRASRDVDVFIVLYDDEDNRIAFSKTVVESLLPGETTTLYFTWPEKFSRPVVRKEVLFVEKP
ncbi:MAG: hypothetical protein HZA81_03855 [Candidatus Taylorbacteria bacterium]|nr:hypothetical protein [Candidatus Taylorbacteria bacterium]